MSVSPRLPLTLVALLAACAAPPGRLYSQEPNEKAARVLEPLLKRPGSGPLFERFVNAWLDSGTLEELGKFLTRRVEKALLESRTLDFDAAIASLGKCLAAKPSGELPLQASQLLGRLQARAGRTD